MSHYSGHAPITIDDVTDKYRQLPADNLRRLEWLGVPTAELRGRFSLTAEEIAEFRENLTVLSRIDLIGTYLGLFQSHNRATPLLRVTANEPDAVFWPVIIEWWVSCDNLRHIRRPMLDAMRHRAARLSPLGFLAADDRGFYDSLPDPVTVYRGCGRRHVRHMSWTTDRDRAAYFARGGRFPSPPQPVIATARVPKAGIFFVTQERKESEVVLDPYRIGRPELDVISQ